MCITVSLIFIPFTVCAYPPRPKNNTGCTAVSLTSDKTDCKLDCYVTSTVKLSIDPQVTWSREISVDNKTFLPLSDDHWYNKIGVDFVNYGKYRCNLLAGSANVYNCSYYLRNCDFDTHFSEPENLGFRLNYQCTVETKDSSITLCATGIY